jgi:thioredoxin reductase (NADPH)
MQERLFKNEKIEVLWHSTLQEVIGDQSSLGVTGARIRNVKTDLVTELAVDGVFIAIGHDPNTSLFKGQLELDSEGYILTKPGTTQTNIPGVYAAGDVQDKIYRQAVTAAGTGCMSALEAESFIAHTETQQEAAE